MGEAGQSGKDVPKPDLLVREKVDKQRDEQKIAAHRHDGTDVVPDYVTSPDSNSGVLLSTV